MTIATQNVNKLIEIVPAFTPPSQRVGSFDEFTFFIEKSLKEILTFKEIDDISDEKAFFDSIHKQIPLFQVSPLETPPCNFSFITICHGEYTHGVGRFIPDMLARWLIPGKQIALNGNRSLLFRFKNNPAKSYFFVEYYVSINDENEKNLIEKNINRFLNDLQLTILSVYHARYIISLKKLSIEQKSAMIEENIASLLHRKNSRKELSAFDQMHDFLIKLSAEKKLSEIQENIKHLLYTRPKTFDRDVFDEMHQLTSQLQNHFTAIRDPRHISRIISFQYLFKKTVKKLLESKKSDQRHISIKVVKTALHNEKEQNVLGILISVNFIRDTEKLNKQQLLKSIKELLSDIQYIPDSYIQDPSDKKICSLYFEIEKSKKKSFMIEEIELLKRRLPSILKAHIESVVTPIFMPRNEEEIFRNIIFLGNQIKFVKDLPQVIISFDKQTGKQIAFTVIFVRVSKPETVPIKDLFAKTQSPLKYIPEEVKQVGFVKKKYPKEANLFRVYMKKTPFFRKDNSLDLSKARRTVVNELTKITGEFRDNNGGLIQKQSQAFDVLKEKLGKVGVDHEFLLENLFYSLRPAIMQSIMDPNILKPFFQLFLKTIKEDYLTKPFQIESVTVGNHFLVMIGSLSLSYKESLSSTISQLELPSLDLTESSLEFNHVSTLGYILKSKDLSQRTHFFSALLEGLKRWEQKAERSRLLDL